MNVLRIVPRQLPISQSVHFQISAQLSPFAPLAFSRRPLCARALGSLRGESALCFDGDGDGDDDGDDDLIRARSPCCL